MTAFYFEVKLGIPNSAGSYYPRGVRFSSKLRQTWALATAEGKSPALKYLTGTNSLSRKAMNALITHVDEHGCHRSPTRYRHIEGPLVELKVKKPKAIRLLAYRLPAGGHVLMAGFDKEDGPIPSDILKAAKRLASDFEKGGLQVD